MQQYHLRPVSELSRSPSSRSSRSPPDHDMSPPSSHLPPIQHSVNGAQAPPRRPLSPSSLPRKFFSSLLVDSLFHGKGLDLDVSNGQAMPPRTYPPPPTGHELMRLFPPQPPEQPLFLKQGSTSLYFRRQEHQFFAQAGKEIIRVRVESDFPPPAVRSSKGKEPVSVPHQWPAVQQQQQQQAQPQPPQPQPTMQPPPPLQDAHMHSPPHPVPPYHHPEMGRGNPNAVVPPPGFAPPHHPAIVRNAPLPVRRRANGLLRPS